MPYQTLAKIVLSGIIILGCVMLLMGCGKRGNPIAPGPHTHYPRTYPPGC